MKKIPSLFLRNFDDPLKKVENNINPVSQWVADGQGVATRKWDGQAVLVEKGEIFKRYDAKTGRTPPEDFRPAQPSADPQSGHWPGWVPVKHPNDKVILESIAWAKTHLFPDSIIPDGTYEACGPKIGTRHGANPERLNEQILVVHGKDQLDDCPRDFDGLRAYLSKRSIEGIVWHHPDGRMAKIKTNDFPPVLKPKPKF